MSDGLSKLVNGELRRATLELNNAKSLPEDKYLEEIQSRVNSLGYNVVKILRDPSNKYLYHLSIIKEDYSQNA